MSNPTKLNTSDINYITFRSVSSGQEFKFPAFLTNFSDTYTSNWNSQDIFGRMDPIYTYKNTVRKIAIGFDVPSYDLNDGKENMRKAENLIRGMYPVYSEIPNSEGTAVLTAPPYYLIRFANLISYGSVEGKNTSVLGWIDSFSFKPELESGFFVENQNLIAKLFKVSFNFNVVHSIPLGYQVGANGEKSIRYNQPGRSSYPYSMDTIPGK